MKSAAHRFKQGARQALVDADLQRALAHTRSRFIEHRREAVDNRPDFESLRERAREIREDSLARLDELLERYEAQVHRQGGKVHWAKDAAEAVEIVARLCVQAQAKRVLKGKSMVSEEIGLNEALQDAGLEVIETDLGEYIIQLAGEPPSHIIAPAVHKSKGQVVELFRRHHYDLPLGRSLSEIPEIVNEARAVLRKAFVSGDVGITGANFLVAETGSSVIVTNEGNGDLSSTLPRVHIVTAGIEKVVPTLEDLGVLLRVLGRSATGQVMTAYTTLTSGPRRGEDPDGPDEYHVVLVDNGRSATLGSEFHDMLRCIRCGACLNHCPVYTSVGGHAYGWVYPGPMGSVLTPLLLGVQAARDLPGACTLNGRCEQVCPVKIPLTDLLRRHRANAFRARLTPARERWALRSWAMLARHPRLYRAATAVFARAARVLSGRRGALRRLPLAGGWTLGRDLPTPAARGFHAQWQRRARR